LSPEAYARMAEHVEPITTQLREILATGIAAGQMVGEDVDGLVRMIMAALAAAGDVEAAVRFVLRATGVRLA
jgi:hypothetical protein